MVEVIYYLIFCVYGILTMSPEGFITIWLTVVLVVLAVLALMIAILAFLGYAGFKDYLKAAVAEQVPLLVKPAMDEHLKQYPDAGKFIELYQELHGFYLFQKKLVTKPEPKDIAPASNSRVQEEKAKVDKDVIPVADYPGEESQNVNPDAESAPDGPNITDSGPGDS